MSEFLGARISLISRSDIRYVGTLHEINSDDSTVSLENVKSFGTEGRKGKPEEEVAPSDQVYEYIVFRGTDVKDLRIEEGPSAAKENKPPAVPNDPAIVGARPRDANTAPAGPLPHTHGPPGAPAHAPGASFGYYPPHMGGWGRGGGPGGGPGPAFGSMPYPPPPGWYPPGQGFLPPGPPPPWGNYSLPPGQGGPPVAPTTNNQQRQNNLGQAARPAPIGASSESKSNAPLQQPAPQSEQQTSGRAQAAPAKPPPPPIESKPTVAEVKATAASLSGATGTNQGIPTGPKGSQPSQILPAVPLPAALTAKSRPTQPSTAKPSSQSAAATAAALRDATQAAKAAVAVAMAKLEAPNNQQTNGSAMDNLTNKVNEMRVNASRGGGSSNRSGRGRGSRPAKVEVPETDFDFASSNAKFNKQDVAKEAIAGSPLTETPNGGENTPDVVADATDDAPPAYSKSKSFFDNISSEAKDRADNSGQKPGGREWRGEEQRRNIETFGQGSVDGGIRGGYRSRGRGRGGPRGRGFGRGGRGGGYRSRDDAQAVLQ